MNQSDPKPTVFIHTNAKQMVGAIVAEHSFRKTSAHNEKFDVRFIRLEDYPALHNRHGKLYLREGKKVQWDNNDLQSFTPLRFLPPLLMGYRGKTTVVDPDVFALKDIFSLLNRSMEGKAVMCRKIIPKDGRPAYFATSVMLLDCEKLSHWKWEEAIEDMFSFKRDYRDWMSLYLEPEEATGILEDKWNHYDLLNEDTCLLHNTGRLTQPWKTGLPIDFTPKIPPEQMPPKWGLIPRPWIERARSFVHGRPYAPSGFYREHPDPNQIRFFFTLLKECIDNKRITESFLQQEIKRGHVRSDALKILESI